MKLSKITHIKSFESNYTYIYVHPYIKYFFMKSMIFHYKVDHIPKLIQYIILRK